MVCTDSDFASIRTRDRTVPFILIKMKLLCSLLCLGQQCLSKGFADFKIDAGDVMEQEVNDNSLILGETGIDGLNFFLDLIGELLGE